MSPQLSDVLDSIDSCLLRAFSTLAGNPSFKKLPSLKKYAWVIGLRGFSNIRYQWSRPMPLNDDPIPTHPISSFWPTLFNNIFKEIIN
jgi:hypothetical protein